MKFINFLLSNKKLHYTLLSVLVLFIVVKIIDYILQPDLTISPHPFGKDYTFTITDDPDKNKFDRIKVIYDFLVDEGFKTTALVWVKRAKHTNLLPIQPVVNYKYGDTLEKEEYLNYFKHLHSLGFEIGTHTISAGADLREETLEGYEIFKKHFGSYPKMVIMHSHNLDNLYWGKYSFTNPIIQYIVGLIAKIPYGGHIEGNKYFWGDFAKENIKHVRLWGTTDLNTYKFNPGMPYHEEEKKYVNYFHSFSDGYNYNIYRDLLTDENINELKEERGIAIVYTHFDDGFVENGQLQPFFKQQMRKISNDSTVWLAPASTVLDRLLQIKNIDLVETDEAYYINNCNTDSINGLTLISNEGNTFYNSIGEALSPNNQGEILIDNIPPLTSFVLYKESSKKQYESINVLNKSDLALENEEEIESLLINETEGAYIFINKSKKTIEKIRIESDIENELYRDNGESIARNNLGQFKINKLNPNKVIVIFKDKSALIKEYTIGFFEEINLLRGRVLVFIKDGNFLMPKYWSD